MDKVIVIRRSSPDYFSNPTEFFSGFWKFQKIRKIWDTTFNINYETYRNFLHDIQKENFKDIVKQSGCEILYLYEIKNLDQLKGKYVIPCDDDDWLLDTIFDKIDHSSYAGRWHSLKLSYSQLEKKCFLFKHADEKFVERKKSKYNYYYFSNNYSLLSPTDIMHLTSHTFMNYDYIFDQFNETYIPEYLSIHNLHLGSLSFLIGQGKEFYQINKELNLVLEEFPYFEKLADKLRQLYRKLRVLYKPFC